MNLMNIARIAKVIALLAFVLPWVAISCSVPGSGTVDLATASGIELIQGKMTANPDAEKQLSGGMSNMLGAGGTVGNDGGLGGAGSSGVASDIPELGVNLFGIGAAAVIVIGLLLSFAGAGKTASRNVLATSILGLVLVFGTVWWWKDQIKKQGGEDGGGTSAASSPFGSASDNPFGGGGAMGGQMVDNMLQERFGYWIAFSALIVAAGAGALGMAGGAAAGVAKPESEPPVV